jgi:hypothetical protein
MLLSSDAETERWSRRSIGNVFLLTGRQGSELVDLLAEVVGAVVRRQDETNEETRTWWILCFLSPSLFLSPPLLLVLQIWGLLAPPLLSGTG